jgi:MoxR-like ATPase
MKAFASDVEGAKRLQEAVGQLKTEIGKVVIGQHDIVDKIILAILCRGHALLIGVPGLAKTLLISTVAQTLDLKFNRIQFTPDLMPGDILGSELLEIDPETGRRYFKFVKGPVFANIVLADEVNRTPPKTQAALLEAMQEKRVTIAGEDHFLDEPFFVLATQNPIEQEGTYPLPEAQLDRFMFSLFVDYPDFRDEVEIVKATTSNQKVELKAVLHRDEILAFQDLVRRVPVADNVVEFAVNLTSKTRINTPAAPEFIKNLLNWGAGPRASQYLVLGAKAHALMRGKYAPDIEDVRAIATNVLRHRIVPSFNAEAEGITADAIVKQLLTA